ncbi:MAG TPA: hypothetical protein VE965_00795, partial [Gammaproteobacteria bacterium]|nr:hypothetical protein [Gammaproteobacteria bacterium]
EKQAIIGAAREEGCGHPVEDIDRDFTHGNSELLPPGRRTTIYAMAILSKHHNPQANTDHT